MTHIGGLHIPKTGSILLTAKEVKEVEDHIDQLQAENAKLRELCGEMLLYIAYPYVCVRPSVLIERARELGVEVDDGQA